jgi:hypothetical protein
MRAALAIAAAAACLVAAGRAAAQPDQPLPAAYARVVMIVNFTTAYVGEMLLACASAGVFSEARADERFKAYLQRNAPVNDRAEAWRRDAERRLRGRADEERAAREEAAQAGLAAVAGAGERVQVEIGAATDARALCATRLAAIEAGAFDLARSAELARLLER